MSQDTESPGDQEKTSSRQSVDVQRQIDQHTAQIGKLYDRWHELGQRRGEITESWSHQPVDEHWRRTLQDIDEEDANIGREIEQLDGELDALYDALRRSQGRPAVSDEESISSSDSLKNKQTMLHRRLHEIADAQIAAVRKWNEDPIEVNRQELEDNLRSLHDEYSKVLNKLKELSIESPPPELGVENDSHGTD